MLALLHTACGDDGGGGDLDAPATDAAIDAATDAGTDGGFVQPTMLSETGLYSDISSETIAPGIVEYVPRWELFSDRAVKRRWVYLPPGTKIDTSDMDWWQFPVGTKFWKEFTRDGVRIETRLIQRIDASNDVSSWYFVSFQWDAEQFDAIAVPGGVVDDPGNNDIPDRSKCRQCHQPSRNRSVILGFGALQLDYVATSDGMDLERLVTEDRLTMNPASSNGGFFPMPEVGASDPTLPALGYLHTNCGGCHNEFSDVKNTVNVELRLTTAAGDRMSWSTTRPWAFVLGPNGTGVPAQLSGSGSHLVLPGDVGNSAVHARMNSITGTKMPPIGRETLDSSGLDAVRLWIESLP
ncbi:MAG: hypothetical protein F9K40_05270 [Kofleriaceae bacterium]|nr:MAG: hypothetical protein F9K40_05270 [Kofleriaceae bacterium]MBZ0232509.1 hypothetical protein [Kofleriaceae bacterium]